MASGSFKVSTDNGYISGTVSWSSTENVSKNQSTVTATMRLERTNTGYTSYGTGDFFVSIDGTKIWDYDKDFSLTYNSNTFIVSGSKVVTHNSDGSKKITIGWGGDSNVFNVYDSSDTATLDTIPRASSLSSSANFTAGQNFTVSVSRHSSSFRHEVEISVKRSDGVWDWIGQVTLPSNDTSVNSGWGITEHAEAYRHLAGRSSAETRFVLQTFDGSTFIGDKTYYGSVTALRSSDIPNGTNWDVYPDGGIYIGISRAHSVFTHTLKIYAGGTLIKTLSGVGSSTTWTPTASEEAAIYAKFPTSTSVDGNIEVFTYYDGELVRSKTDNDINFYIRNSNPSFSASNVSYTDIDTTVTPVTGDASYIVQGKSNLQINVHTAATALNSATISKYVISVAGQSQTLTATTGVANFYDINISSNTTAYVTAYDSRGFTTRASFTVKSIPYHVPTLSDSIRRKNNFENETTISVSGNIALMTIGSVNKNSIQYAQYSWKDKSSATWSAWTNLSLTMNGENYSATATRDFDNGKAYDIQIRIIDRLSTTLVTRTLSAGKPLFMPDPNLLSVGINKQPVRYDAVDVGSHAYFDKSIVHYYPGFQLWRNLAAYSGAGSLQGAFVIELPYGMVNVMSKITIDGYIYDSTAPFKIEVGFYSYQGNPTPSFVNTGYTNYGGKYMTVRLGRNTATGNVVIIIGSESHSYSYPKLTVSQAILTHSIPDQVTLQSRQWNITQKTSLSGYDLIQTVPNVTLNGGIPSIEVGLGQESYPYYSWKDSGGRVNSITQLGNELSVRLGANSIANEVAKFTSNGLVNKSSGELLWSGGYYMTAGHTVTPSKTLTSCPNGWVLVFSDFDSNTNTTNPYNIVQCYIHKAHYDGLAGQGMYFTLGTAANTYATKYLYVSYDWIKGHDENNDTAQQTDVVLKEVRAW
ncbi:hypothetical protein J7E38_13670 [Bacillus sp. ISL-35]|uniref:DUF859 family phage minor structural protein n=1 Tax=Bacillus sp. ISL-35 TaxID=2819122 RepID=UPI001BE77634|nr:DUF859 family phage minor structural protein [Bacillus sp. ISL-35]MBT2680058.1 hypothetical protein [Bacillus sp. ISL-35]MBT2702965.1 hypothetical protein [Chryseobacterium sp. ISL-80]